MNERTASAAAALNVMREWQWRYCDPDGTPFPPGKDLCSVVNRLALDGIARPDKAVLALLCSGDLVARGDFSWRKYQHGNIYQLEGADEILKPLRWQQLANSIADELRQLAGDEWPSFTVDLERLGIKECPRYEWEFSENRFCTAICPPDTEYHAPDYIEEWYSAWEVQVWPESLSLLPADDESASAPALPNTNKGGRPSVADWEAAALEIAGRYYRGDFKPQTIADVSRELLSWLGQQNSHPSESVVRIHAKRIYDAFEAWERE